MLKLACEGEKIAKMQNLSKFKPAAVLAAGRFLWAKTAFPEQVIPSPQALAGVKSFLRHWRSSV